MNPADLPCRAERVIYYHFVSNPRLWDEHTRFTRWPLTSLLLERLDDADLWDIAEGAVQVYDDECHTTVVGLVLEQEGAS